MGYRQQATRVHDIVTGLGLSPMTPFHTQTPAMSWAYLSPKEIPLERLMGRKSLTFGKYYKPIANLPKTISIYNHLINIPTHSDMAGLSDDALIADLKQILA